MGSNFWSKRSYGTHKIFQKAPEDSKERNWVFWSCQCYPKFMRLEVVLRCFNLFHNYLSFFVISYFKSTKICLNNINTSCNRLNFIIQLSIIFISLKVFFYYWISILGISTQLVLFNFITPYSTSKHIYISKQSPRRQQGFTWIKNNIIAFLLKLAWIRTL